jgi:RNA 3'-terminal phosphate cyclase (ATP)
MDWQLTREQRGPVETQKRWVTHASHDTLAAPHRVNRGERRKSVATRLITLDGSEGEGGGQILRTALSLSLLTGHPFRIAKIRANRDKPGLRPQHLKAVEAAAMLADAEIAGAAVGSRDLTFRPTAYQARDLEVVIGTAGSTALVLQTLHLPLALRAEEPVRVTLLGGTFNEAAPSFPFLDETWRAHMAALGAPIALVMPAVGFYPRGGGRVEAWIEPANLTKLTLTERGPLVMIRGVAGIANLRRDIAERMRARAEAHLTARGFPNDIKLMDWPGIGQGAAISLTAEHEHGAPVTFVGLGERGKPSEVVADEAVSQLLEFEAAEGAAVDAHSADQLLVPLALAPGRSEYTVADVTQHLHTNAATIGAFLDRTIEIDEPRQGRPGRVVVA